MDVVGRERELETIVRHLEGHGESDTLLITGEPGLGKTTLCRAAARLAAERGVTVLKTIPAAAESRISNTAIRDLVTGSFAAVEKDIPVPQRSALAVALLLDESRGPPPDEGTIAVALRSAFDVLAASSPVLVLIDDVQWLDSTSARALRYVLRRPTDRPVRFLLARRTGLHDDLGLDRLGDDRLETLELDSLTVGAVAEMLMLRLGATYPRPTLRRLYDMSGGNPLFALELARALGDTTRPLHPCEPFPLPDNLTELVRGRLSAMSPEALEMLAVVAALSRPTTELIDAALGEPTDVLLDEATAGHVLEIDGNRVAFTHPLLAAAAYDLLSRSARLELHRRVSCLVADPEERARHRALSTSAPCAATAAELEVAARLAVARGAASAAAELHAECFRLTPQADVEARTNRALEAGWYQFVVGDTGRAHDLIEEAVRVAPPGPLHARASIRLGWLNHHAGDRGQAQTRYVAALAETNDPAEQGLVHSLLAWSYSIRRVDMSAAIRHGREAVRIATELGDRVLLVDALAVLAQAEFFAGGGLPSRRMEEVLAMELDAADPRILRQPVQHWAVLLLCADRFDEARPLFANVIDHALAQGDESAIPWPLMRLSHLELAAGDWTAASAHARAGIDAATQTGQRPVLADLDCTEALVLAHQGDGVAQGRATGALARAEEVGAGIGRRLAQWALAIVELDGGDAAAAADRLRRLHMESDTAGVVDPGENRYLGDLGAALVQVGALDEARSVARRLGRLGGRLERPSAVAIAERIEAQVAAEEGSLGSACEHLDRALVAHSEAPLPFELARTLYVLGVVQRRSNRRRDARETLARAAELFDALGATTWSERTYREAARIGGRASSGSELTASEARIAELVARGLTNREVAEELFVSIHTVEAALTSIYRKLAIRSRTQLARALPSADTGKH